MVYVCTIKQKQHEMEITTTVYKNKETHELTTYRTIAVQVLGNTWTIMEVSGQWNYVSVCKKTNNPHGGRIGKDFPTWDAACRHYKSPEMKTALLMAEINFKNS